MKTAILTLLVASSMLAQTAPTTCAAVPTAAAKSEFAAASIDHSPLNPAMLVTGGALIGGPRTNDPGRITGANLTLQTFVMAAYGLSIDQVSGPDWTRGPMNNFTFSATLPTTTTQEEYCGMLRNLLTSRFHLVFHIEKQLRPGYELTVLPGGPKFKHYDPKDRGPEAVPNTRQDKNGFPVLPPAQPRALSTSMNSSGMRKISFRDDMDAFARGLGSDINQSNGLHVAYPPIPRVANMTGLTGIYEIRLQFSGPVIMGGLPAANGAGTPAPPPPFNFGAGIFNAVQQQLGLKLTQVKDVPVDVLIIDHADQTPTEN